MMDQIGQVYRRAMSLIARGRVTLADDAGPVQTLQLRLSALQLQQLPRIGEYGLQSNPPVGTDTVVVFLGGDRGNGLVIATNNQALRMRNLGTGEVALTDDKGQSVYLSAAGIKVDGGGLPVEVSNTPSLTVIAADIRLQGNVTIDGTTTLNGPIVQTAAGTGTASRLIGPLTVEGDISTGDINLTTHTHGGIVRGSARTDGPL